MPYSTWLHRYHAEGPGRTKGRRLPRGDRMPSRSCLFLLLFLMAMLVTPVSAGLPSVIVSDVQMSPPVLMPGDQGLVSITL